MSKRGRHGARDGMNSIFPSPPPVKPGTTPKIAAPSKGASALEGGEKRTVAHGPGL